jgi:uncharacterized protein (DUF2141 family)
MEMLLEIYQDHNGNGNVNIERLGNAKLQYGFEYVGTQISWLELH